MTINARSLAIAALAFLALVSFAQGQEGKPAKVKIVLAFENYVKANQQQEFATLVSDFRAAVDGLIKKGKLTDAEKKAYADFRILKSTTVKDGTVLFTFLMDPWHEGVSYSMTDYFTRALGEDEAKKKIAKFQSMLAGPQKAVRFTEH